MVVIFRFSSVGAELILSCPASVRLFSMPGGNKPWPVLFFSDVSMNSITLVALAGRTSRSSVLLVITSGSVSVSFSSTNRFFGSSFTCVAFDGGGGGLLSFSGKGVKGAFVPPKSGVSSSCENTYFI